MNELFDSLLRLLVLIVASCIAIRLAYDTARPALPLIGLAILVVAVVRIVVWYRDRW